ncbi:MAG: N-acetylmuramoyl-L-alanine amidase [Parasphingorhabdus sp.]|jgi:N-acetylmuramoyl-L-alanine amidase
MSLYNALSKRLPTLLILPAMFMVTISALLPNTTQALTGTEMGCLALNVYHEARGETRQGQLAVAAVTLNRVRSSKFPTSVCSVVWQPKQFSWTHTQSSYFPTDLKSWSQAQEIARTVLDQKVVANYRNLLFYHSKKVRPFWIKEKRFVARVGSHLFYSS